METRAVSTPVLKASAAPLRTGRTWATALGARNVPRPSESKMQFGEKQLPAWDPGKSKTSWLRCQEGRL